jgi:hypothetical protein
LKSTNSGKIWAGLSFEKNIIKLFEVLKSTNSGKIWAGLSFEKYINKLFEV